MENLFREVRGLLSAQDQSQTAQMIYFSYNPFHSLTPASETSFFWQAIFLWSIFPCTNNTVIATSNGNLTCLCTSCDEEDIHRDRKTLFLNPQLSA